MLTIDPKILKAAAQICPKSAARPTLQLVSIQVKNRICDVVATDSYLMFWNRSFVEDCEDMEVLIPAATLLSVINASAKLAKVTNNSLTLVNKSLDIISTVELPEPVTKNYVNWRVLMKCPALIDTGFTIALNADKLAQVCKAIKCVYGKDSTVKLVSPSPEKAIFATAKDENSQTTLLLMPIRDCDYTIPRA